MNVPPGIQKGSPFVLSHACACLRIRKRSCAPTNPACLRQEADDQSHHKNHRPYRLRYVLTSRLLDATPHSSDRVRCGVKARGIYGVLPLQEVSYQVWREPMFAFEIDQALFEFEHARPQCEPLYALPPHSSTSSPSTYRPRLSDFAPSTFTLSVRVLAFFEPARDAVGFEDFQFVIVLCSAVCTSG